MTKHNGECATHLAEVALVVAQFGLVQHTPVLRRHQRPGQLALFLQVTPKLDVRRRVEAAAAS